MRSHTVGNKSDKINEIIKESGIACIYPIVHGKEINTGKPKECYLIKEVLEYQVTSKRKKEPESVSVLAYNFEGKLIDITITGRTILTNSYDIYLECGNLGIDIYG